MGLQKSLELGADIIVNTDADNQYCADDIEKLLAPILSAKADIVIGSRDISNIKEIQMPFSNKKVIEEKPDYFKSEQDALLYLLATKGEEWKHEQEVRYCIYKPCLQLEYRLNRPVKENEIVDWEEVRFYPHIDPTCFRRLYLGCKISTEDKCRIMKVAEKLPGDLEIYQMEIDPCNFSVIPNRIR